MKRLLFKLILFVVLVVLFLSCYLVFCSCFREVRIILTLIMIERSILEVRKIPLDSKAIVINLFWIAFVQQK